MCLHCLHKQVHEFWHIFLSDKHNVAGCWRPLHIWNRTYRFSASTNLDKRKNEFMLKPMSKDSLMHFNSFQIA